MSMELVVETGAGVATANTYITVAEADTILDERLHSEDWNADLDEHKKAQALVMAFRLLNNLAWYGQAATETQAGAWPRSAVTNRLGLATLDSATIPDDVKRAQAVLARRLVATDRYEAAEQQAVLSAGGAGRSKSVAVGNPRNLALLSVECWTYIGCYVNRTTVKLTRAA